VNWNELELPENWTVQPLTEVADVVMGQSPPGTTYNAEGRGLPFFQSRAEFGEDHPTARKWCSAPIRIADPGDILMSIRAPVGPTNVADQRCAVGRGLAVIKARPGVPPNLIRHAIQLQEIEIASWGTGTTFTAIKRRHFNDIQIPLPPHELRQSMAAALDEIVRLRRSSAAHLGAAGPALKRFRQAVLAAACSGRLSADWRERRDDGSGRELVNQIVAKSAAPGRNRGVLEAAEPLGDVPDSWGAAPFGILVSNYDGKRVPVTSNDRAKRKGTYPYYGASGIIDQVDDYLFDGNYLLISEDGANLVARTTPIAFRASGKFWVNNHAHVVHGREGVLDTYLEIVINGRDLQMYVTGSAQPKLTQVALNGLPIPVPSTAEQRVIADHVEHLISLASRLDARIQAAERKVQRSSQAVLAKAFRGELRTDGLKHEQDRRTSA
jgi:restriction endonuclease S subunit